MSRDRKTDRGCHLELLGLLGLVPFCKVLPGLLFGFFQAFVGRTVGTAASAAFRSVYDEDPGRKRCVVVGRAVGSAASAGAVIIVIVQLLIDRGRSLVLTVLILIVIIIVIVVIVVFEVFALGKFVGRILGLLLSLGKLVQMSLYIRAYRRGDRVGDVFTVGGGTDLCRTVYRRFSVQVCLYLGVDDIQRDGSAHCRGGTHCEAAGFYSRSSLLIAVHQEVVSIVVFVVDLKVV